MLSIDYFSHVWALMTPYPLPPNFYINAQDMCGYFAFDYINTTNKCLLFHYYWAGLVQLPHSSYIQFFLLGEDNLLELIKEVVAPPGTDQTYNYHTDWSLLLVALPSRPGLHRVVIQGILAGEASDYYAALVLDDIAIRPCSDFSELMRISIG
jgi:hypothetical protein